MAEKRPSYATSDEANSVIPRLVTESHYLDKTLPVFAEAFQAFLANQDDPLGMQMYNLRMRAEKLQWTFKQIGGLLAILDGTPKAVNELSPDLRQLLETFGLTIAPHSDRARGWGYTWRDRSWEGPYPTQADAVRAAFEDAIKALHARSIAPFPAHDG